MAPVAAAGCHHVPVPERVYTRPLLDKLGVAPGARVAVVDLDAPWFTDLLAERTHDVTVALPEPDTDLIFLGAEMREDLAPLADLRRRIRPNGAIWVVSRKGRAATLRGVDVIEGALAAGLVDNKVCSVSDDDTAMRFVIRKSDRRA